MSTFATITTINFRTFHHIPTNPCPLAVTPYSPQPPPAPGNHSSALHLYGFACSVHFISMGSYSVWKLSVLREGVGKAPRSAFLLL